MAEFSGVTIRLAVDNGTLFGMILLQGGGDSREGS